jgi:hypothetical protein
LSSASGGFLLAMITDESYDRRPVRETQIVDLFRASKGLDFFEGYG